MESAPRVMQSAASRELSACPPQVVAVCIYVSNIYLPTFVNPIFGLGLEENALIPIGLDQGMYWQSFDY